MTDPAGADLATEIITGGNASLRWSIAVSGSAAAVAKYREAFEAARPDPAATAPGVVVDLAAARARRAAR